MAQGIIVAFDSKDLTAMKRPKTASRPMALSVGEAEEYGYGLCLRLENWDLDQLKLSMPQPGKEFKITAIGVVTNVSESKSKDNLGDRCVSIQITDLALR